MSDSRVGEREHRRLAALGTAITSLREAAGESKSAMARATGINRFFLTGVEAGQRNISIARLFDIADHFGVAPADLLEDVT